MAQKPLFQSNDSLWTEKYRPISLDTYITSSDFKEKFKNFIEKQDIPNLIFSGSAGTGKSSLANILIRSIESEYKYFNASNDRGIGTVREIEKFAASSSFSSLKVVVCEEADGLTPEAQLALREAAEKYSFQTRFIFTCNSLENIIEPLRSRCQEYIIYPPSKEQVKSRCKFILKSEEADYEEEELDEIIRHYYPDVRKCIQYLDQQCINKVLKLDREFFKLLQYERKVIDILKNVSSSNLEKAIEEVRQLIADTKIRNFITLYKYLYEKLNDYCNIASSRLKIIFIIQQGLKDDTFIPDKEINIITTILKIAEVLSEK